MELTINSTRLANTDEQDENLTICERCGEAVEDTYTVVTDWYSFSRDSHHEWCADCVDTAASECEDCHTLFADRYIEEYHLYTGEYINICQDCRSDNYYYCEDCGDLVPNDDVCWGNDDEPYCPNCIGYHRRSDSVHGYGHTAGTTFWFDDGAFVNAWELTHDDSLLMFLGIELEVDYLDSVNDLADDLMREFGYERLECKEDGSLSDDGLEIVSQPMTALYHLNSDMWVRILDLVRQYGGKSHDAGDCGLHIHISRKFFKDHDAVYRLDRLFHRFKDELVNFSRRTCFGYCRLYDDDLHEIKDVAERKAKWEEEKSWQDRYQAVNDKNTNTVEIRLWRGTLNDETFRATVEMTAALAIVANSMSNELADSLTWPMLKLLLRYALDANGIPRVDFDNYLVRRSL